jgi:tetratricopeptide (TPR) repeat protein
MGLIVGLLAAGAGAQDADPPAAGAAADFQPPDPQRIGSEYLAFINDSGRFDQNQREQVSKVRRQIAAGDNEEAQDLISRSLRALYPDFDRALRLLGDERTDRALGLLGKLQAGDDPYLAAYARFYAARAYAMQEKFELARPLLDRLTTADLNRTLHSGQAMFYRGVAQAETLDRRSAMTTLATFVRHYPDESERMVIGALHLLDELSYIQPGSMGDVQDRMDYSRRRLDIGKSDEPTRDEQGRIVAMIEKLIEQEQDKEDEQSNSSGSGASGGMQSAGPGRGGPPSGADSDGNNGANQSAVSPGQARIGRLHRVIRGDDSWGQAREHERQEVLNAIKARYPERYRQIIEQYYRSMQEEN